MRIYFDYIPKTRMRGTFYAFLLVSIAIHLISLSGKIDIFKNQQPPSMVDNKKDEPIKLKLIQEKKKQIVETNQSESERNLDKIKDRFLSNKRNVFKKETIAKNIGKFQNNSQTGTKSKSKINKANESLKKLSLKDFILSDLSKYKVEKVKVDGKRDSEKEARKISKVSQTNDFIDDVPIGELTQLNTSEFKFYGFYYRIKQRLEQHWGNSLREKARKLSRRKIASSGNKITALVVILDRLGRIVRVHLKSTSGVEELDAAAIESFNKAGPFPNPPKEMLENGKAKIEWGFVVKA